MSDTEMRVKIGDDLIKGIVNAKISTAIASEMGNKDVIIQRIVDAVLSHRVNSDGSIDKYNSSSSVPYIEWLSHETIREAAQNALKSWIEQNKETIEKHLKEQLKRRQSEFAKIFMDGLIENLKSSYYFICDVSFKKDGDY